MSAQTHLAIHQPAFAPPRVINVKAPLGHRVSLLLHVFPTGRRKVTPTEKDSGSHGASSYLSLKKGFSKSDPSFEATERLLSISFMIRALLLCAQSFCTIIKLSGFLC